MFIISSKDAISCKKNTLYKSSVVNLIVCKWDWKSIDRLVWAELTGIYI